MQMINDRILLRKPKDEKSAGGLYIVDAKERHSVGEVVATGPGWREDGTARRIQVRVGDSVVYETHRGASLRASNGDEFVVVREDDVVMVL